ncbi:DUF6221 family protein, partial [Streptomyces sp. NPDC056663]|uniref:DUF6221 family protein n=1 Tax=Streptomyces sp. NPDC056663 TaxID=3345899 RepID=UPI00368524F9
MDLSGFHPTIAQHVALHDPARVLRDVEAKRRVLARHVLSPAIDDPELPWDNRDDCQLGLVHDRVTSELACPVGRVGRMSLCPSHTRKS